MPHPGGVPGMRRPGVLGWLGAVLVAWLVLPIVTFLVRAPGQLRVAASQHQATPGLGGALVTSVVSATISLLVVACLGIPLARVLARSTSRFGRLVGVLVQLPLALPPVMSGVVLIYLVGPYTWLGSLAGGRLTDSLAGVVLAQTFVAAPFLVIAARSAFAAVDADLDGLAASLGLSPAARFWRVDLPLAWPGVLAGALLTWLRAIGEYGATSLLAYHPYTLPVFTAVQFDGGGLPATVAPTLLALALALVVLALVGVHPPRPRGRATRLPGPQPPPPATPTPVAIDLHHRVGDFELHLAHAASSHRLAIVGASGAGKSLTLKAIAGLLDAGTVRLGDDDVSAVPAHRRHVGWVPQARMLFAHRSVWRNAVFSPDADPARAAWWLRRLGLEHLADRRPAGLSGGERQRASLVQALAHNPRVLLLDEPFSALDTATHQELRTLLRRVQRERGLSSVLVTHDPEDALLLSDEVVVLVDGRVAQAGRTLDVLGYPTSPAVARLLGVSNVLPGVVADDGILLDAGPLLPLGHTRDVMVGGIGDRVLVQVPVDAVRLQPADATTPAQALSGTVCDTLATPAGHRTSVLVDGPSGLELTSTTSAPSGIAWQIGEPITVHLDADRATWWRVGG